jgi:hypothetical protein
MPQTRNVANNFKEVMGTSLLAEVVTIMNQNRKLYSEMNQPKGGVAGSCTTYRIIIG